jgi:Protein of unknown function (DUF2971)
MQLFKYVEPARVDILENERIAFTPPNRFKDPFEFRPAIAPPRRRYLKHELREATKQEWLESPDFYRGLNRKQRRVEDKKASKEAFRLIKSGKASHSEHFQDSLVNVVSKGIGLLCLCATGNENLMWYHYADGHRGFVIEFNTDHADFQKLGKAYEVIYSDKPPIYDFEKPSLDHWRFKPKYLKYEAEYRIMANLPNSTPHKTPDGQPLYLANLPRACVKAVYLGHRMEKKVRDKILQILSGTSIGKIDVIPNRDDYTLSYREVK